MIQRFKEWCAKHGKVFHEELDMALIAHMKDENFFRLPEPDMDKINEGSVEMREEVYRILLCEYVEKTPKNEKDIRSAAYKLSIESGVNEQRALTDLWSVLIPERPLIL